LRITRNDSDPSGRDDGYLSLAWTDNADNETSWTLHWRSHPGATESSATVSGGHPGTGEVSTRLLTSRFDRGTTYTFWVTVHNAGGTVFSNQIDTVPLRPVPAPPPSPGPPSSPPPPPPTWSPALGTQVVIGQSQTPPKCGTAAV